MKLLFYFSLFILTIISCKKEVTPNPFIGEIVNQDTVSLEIIDPDPNSIAGIYQNVFKPTCSNIGCHDGTFEPDFRTMESSYNTLIFQTNIKNDGKYTYRVHPGNPEKSVLMARLENALGPFMPIQIEPDSDWPVKGDEYIENIRNWINKGAPDITGVVQTIPYPTPSLKGSVAFIKDTLIHRTKFSGPLQMPLAQNEVVFYFSFDHNEIDSKDLTYNKIAFSSNAENYDSSKMYDLLIIDPPIRERGFNAVYEEFTHKIVINPVLDLDSTINQWFYRVYVQDDKNPVTEIPTNDAIYYIKNYMSFEWTR